MARHQPSPAEMLATMQALEAARPLSILHLAEPILAEDNNTTREPQATTSTSSSHQKQQRASDSGITSALDPASLEADLTHYRELFSKLRFSYLEQVTKEKYLRSIVGDPPVLVTPAENAVLEERLVGMKAELKMKKDEVDALVKEMEGLARDVARKWDGVKEGKDALGRLPGEIEGMRVQVEELRRSVGVKRRELGGDNAVRGSEDDGGGSEGVILSLEQTVAAVEERRRQNRELDAQIEALQRQMPVKTRECEKAEKELEDLERKRNEATKAARDVRRIKEEGGRDLLSEQGRWYKSSETVLKGLLSVEA